MSSRSLRPIISSMVRKPSSAISSRTSWATNWKKLTTCSALPAELLAELGVLGGDADRAGVEVADPHHDAAHDDQRGGGEAVFLGPEQSGDHHVAAGLHLAVGLDDDPVAELVEHERLLGLGQAQLPGDAGVLDRGQRAGAGAAVMAADQDDVAVGLGHARGDRADADLGHELDADPRPGIAVLEVEDELGQVLDRVDVVVRRRADQADARASSTGPWRSRARPCGREAGPPRRAWPPGPS